MANHGVYRPMRKRMEIKLGTLSTAIQKLTNWLTFKHSTSFYTNFAAVKLIKQEIEFWKPIYIGFPVLDILKTMIYNYHYNVMKKHYGDDITLMYIDAGKCSIIIFIFIRLNNMFIIFVFFFRLSYILPHILQLKICIPTWRITLFCLTWTINVI